MSPQPSSRTVRALAIGVLMVLLAVSAACGSGDSSVTINGITYDRFSTVPALWAGTNSAGEPVGGIEPVEVLLSEGGPPGLQLDLTTIEAQGAGASWNSATASASVVSLFLSGADPEEFNISFRITGPIDGPSAGGVLTVGLLAALKDEPLDKDVTMTGTISPDGSIGAVGGVPTKIEAAKKAGFDTVLVPTSNFESSVPSSEFADLAEFGRSLDIEVIPVSTVSEAYLEFTGEPFTPVTDARYSYTDVEQSLLSTMAREFLDRLDGALAAAGSVPTELRTAVSDQAGQARAALAAGDAIAAYAVATDASTRLARAEGDARAEQWLSEGDAAAQSRALAELDALIARTEADILAWASLPDLGWSQQVTLPVIIEMLAFPRAVLLANHAQVTDLPTADNIRTASRAAADQQIAIEVLAPDSLRLMLATPSGPAADPTEVAAFLSDYTDVLLLAGDANETYYSTVTRGTVSENERYSTSWHLRDAAKSIPDGTAPLVEEIIRSADAVAYYLGSAILVSRSQALGLRSMGITSAKEPDGSIQEDALRASLDAGADTVLEFAAALQSTDIDSAYAVWTTQWGSAAVTDLEGTSRALVGQVRAIRNQWHSALNVFMMSAAADRFTRPAAE